MRRRQGRLAAWLLLPCLLLSCLLLGASRARASYEEFATLDVGREEEDDENLLDHVLVRPPIDWRDEWEQARGGFRTAEGCFTSGQWFLDHELKVRVPMGDTTYMDLGIRDVNDEESVYGWTQFDVRFPLRYVGLWGIRFRPNFDKSRQDAALMWDHGDFRSPLQVQAAFTIEDIFNKFWAARQTRVGDDREPYVRHPFEPELRVAWRGGGRDLTLHGKWLTPSTKRFETLDRALRRTEKLWGAKGDAVLTHDIGIHTFELAYEEVQAKSYAYYVQDAGDHHVFRRRWRIEGAWLRPVGEHGRIALRYFYQERTQVWRPPISNATLGVIDRMPMIEGWFRGPAQLGVRVGFLRNRVTVVDDGGIPVSTWGTRVETRAFFSLQRRFGRVRVAGIEGIELDKERYPVSFHHDKGFLHIQTTF